MKTLSACSLLGLLGFAAVCPAEEQVEYVQPVLEYMVREPIAPTSPKGKYRINPFIAYTHLGTDFGFHGPGERFITWQDHQVCMTLDSTKDWAGMWHSLAGLASSSSDVLDIQHCYPDLILPALQPRVTHLEIKAMGKGKIKLEIKGADQALLWSDEKDIDSAEDNPIPLKAIESTVSQAKFLNWTAEPGSDLCLTRLSMKMLVPKMDFDRYVLLASYAKMARCYTTGHGLLKDRAHVPTGAFDSVSASGLFALATAVVSQPDVGFVSPEKAREVLRTVQADVDAIPTAMGLLPHFVKRINGKSVIHPGTEFSTVDTALCLHGLLLASEILNDMETKGKVMDAIRRIDFAALTLDDGAISHGVKDNGRTLIKFAWHDWGGETALVMLLDRLANGESQPKGMGLNGHPWQGTGFIAEIQSLFYPDFDSATPDAVSKVNWRDARRKLLDAQKAYFPAAQPKSRAALDGFYGLSAGEGAYGTTYEVGGTDLQNQKLVHPHYILMSAVNEDDPHKVYELLTRMKDSGYFTPWGMVENISADGSRYLPMISALNAGFETLGAYNLLAKNRKWDNAIYKASYNSPELRAAVKLFYPSAVAAR